MALINCPECGREVSDKAVNCPSCGYPLTNPINEVPQSEEVLCCPKCSSQELHAEKSGFSGGKAVVGAALVGGVGLLAGTIGSRDVKITCLKCGHQFKAGEARILKKGALARELDKKIIWLLCENQTLEATELYKVSTNCSIEEAYKHIRYLIETEVPKHITEEQKEKMNKYYEELKANKGGCAGVLLVMILAGASLLLL